MERFGNISIFPIAAESFGVRSFSFLIYTPDFSIITDPGCALGPHGRLKVPHPYEFIRLLEITEFLTEISEICDILFISHFHHDHFKPNLTDRFYINTDYSVFSKIFRNKLVIMKNFTDRRYINYNQRRRGNKLTSDLRKLNKKIVAGGKFVRYYIPGRDKFSEIIFDIIKEGGVDSEKHPVYRGNTTEILKPTEGIKTEIRTDNSVLLFPEEFLHGYRSDGRKFFLQPLIICGNKAAFYFFPDVQGMESIEDVKKLMNIKKYIEKSHTEIDTHIIAMGGPFKPTPRSIRHTELIISEYERVFLDHHVTRLEEFDALFARFLKTAEKYGTVLTTLGGILTRQTVPPYLLYGNLRRYEKNIDERLNAVFELCSRRIAEKYSVPKNYTVEIPITERYREMLYERYPPGPSFIKWVDTFRERIGKEEIETTPPDNFATCGEF